MATCKDCLFKCYTDDVDRVEETCNFFLPTDEYAKVVRCKDCKYCMMCYPEKQIGKEATPGWYCKDQKKYRRPDDFCSYGERRTDV